MSVVRSFVFVVTALLLPSFATAQSTPGATASVLAQQGQAATDPDQDLRPNPAQPDFTLGALPTTLRMPSGKFAFRLTHRFARPIASGSAGDFFADFFGFDSSARVGFELRYGVRPGTQVALHRTNDRAIQILGQQQVVRFHHRGAVTADAVVAVEGENNLSEHFSGTVGAVIGHELTDRGAVYAQPLFVSNTNHSGTGDRHTMLLGLGARLRLGKSRTYIVAEAAPQIGGYRDGVDHVSFGIEKRAGGHVFQFNVSNALGTTFRQIARGGVNKDDWFIGFNLTRKFF
ncbi:MAG TPA: DUF5777 family beta-barrel protein [Vicinamibacterales bacterium]|nr:DUF5777 family beta-barrel protein [Vicinamibacterales bacterium]